MSILTTTFVIYSSIFLSLSFQRTLVDLGRAKAADKAEMQEGELRRRHVTQKQLLAARHGVPVDPLGHRLGVINKGGASLIAFLGGLHHECQRVGFGGIVHRLKCSVGNVVANETKLFELLAFQVAVGPDELVAELADGIAGNNIGIKLLALPFLVGMLDARKIEREKRH